MKNATFGLLLLSMVFVQNSYAGVLSSLWAKIAQVSERPIEFHRDIDTYPRKIRSLGRRTIEAYQNDKPIGYVTYGSDISESDKCSIGILEVSEDYRRKNIGSTLAKLAMDELEQCDQCEQITLSATNSGRFWQSLGFEFNGPVSRGLTRHGLNEQESGHMVYYTAIHREKQKRLLRFEEMLHSWSVEYN